MNGVHFYSVLWQINETTYDSTIEAATSRRWLSDQIHKGVLVYADAPDAKLVKIQQIETPIVNMTWLTKMLETGCTKESRKENAKAASYVLNLVEKCAARIIIEENEEERLIER